MQELNYRLNVRAPGATEWRVIPRDASFIRRSGLALPLTPEGDAREARFTAKGKNIAIPCLSAVQVEHLSGSTWNPIYYGLVRQGGNSRDVYGEVYVLRSMSERLKEVGLSEDFTAPAQAAHLTVQAIIQDVLPRLAGLIEFDAALCPDLGFTFGAVNASNYETAWELLERIRQAGEALTVAGLHVPVYVRFGVRPDRKFFCVTTKTDVLVLTDADLGLVKWHPPVAEKPCTHVRWLLGKQPGGRWVTHDSYSEHYATLGEYMSVVPIGQGLNPWKPVTPTYTVLTAGSPPVFSPKAPQPGVDATVLTDGVMGANAAAYTVTDTANWLMLQLDAPGMRRVVVDGKSARNQTLFGWKDPGSSIVTWGNELARGSSVTGAYYIPEGMAAYLTQAARSSTDPDQSLTLSEFRPEAIDTDLLDGLARSHYSVPAQDPADVTLRRFLTPAELTGRVRVGTWERPVEGWEYRISGDVGNGGLEIVAQTGQLESPQALARNILLKAQAQRATVQALTAQT